MAKRKRINSTDTRIEKWIKEGRGQGEGANYKPWLNIQDVASKGYATRDLGWKTNRIHHFLSNLEMQYFYTLEWSQEVEDIREQYPLLPIEKTIAIAEEIGVEHPRENGKTGPYKVITSDFFIVKRTKKGLETCIRTIKPVNNLTVREMEKFDIERRYFSDMGINNWAIVTDSDLPKDFIKNMDWLYDCKNFKNRPSIDERLVYRIESTLFKALKVTDLVLSRFALKYDDIFGFEDGTCLFVIKYLIANKIWITDMGKLIDTSQKLEVFKKDEETTYSKKEA